MELSLEEYIERLFEASQKKYENLQDILAITKVQSETISEDNIDVLQKLISDKQLKIDNIDKLDEEFNVYFQRMKAQLKIKNLDELENPSIKGLKELKEQIAAIMKLLTKISELERDNNHKAKSLLDSLGNEIKKINQMKRVNNVYKPTKNQYQSYYIDKKK
jgi:hypothetical protein